MKLELQSNTILKPGNGSICVGVLPLGTQNVYGYCRDRIHCNLAVNASYIVDLLLKRSSSEAIAALSLIVYHKRSLIRIKNEIG